MLDLLDRNGIPYIGGGRTLAEAHRPLLIERKGVRIAFLAYNEFLPRSLKLTTIRPASPGAGRQVRLDIALARSRHRADIVIPFMHWGWENEAVANPRQRQLARLLIDAGADAVVGLAIPHVTQDIEIIGGKPVIYSLGNFVARQFYPRRQQHRLVTQNGCQPRNGVREWRIDEVRIDKEGLPFPAPPSKSRCWQQGMESAVACPMQSH